MIPDPCTTVAFTGHRTYCGEASAALAAAIRGLHAHGFRTFLCGMAVGFDLAAAEAVLELRDSLPGLRLVDHASLLVAWYDGSPGGTRHTVSRALRRGLEFVNLHPLRAGVALTEPTLF